MSNKREFSFVTLKKSRKLPLPGHIFVYQLKAEPELFRFGMVVAVKECDKEQFLIYLYKATSKDKKQIPELSKNDLLIPPFFIWDYSWRYGTFENVAKIDLTKEMVLDYHVFFEDLPVDEHGKETTKPYKDAGPYSMQTEGHLEEEILPLLGYESLLLKEPEPDFTTTDIEPEPYPELTEEQADTARELVTKFYNDLEKIARYYDDIDDTVVRENMAWILSHGFIWGEPVREPILNVGMFGKRGNERVGKALTDLFAAANASEVMASIPFGQARLDILQDITIETKKGEPYDTFIGHSDKLYKYSELKDWLFEKYTNSWPP